MSVSTTFGSLSMPLSLVICYHSFCSWQSLVHVRQFTMKQAELVALLTQQWSFLPSSPSPSASGMVEKEGGGGGGEDDDDDAVAAEMNFLASHISTAFSSYTSKVGQNKFQCLVCAAHSKTLCNHRSHLMTHLKEDKVIWSRLDQFCNRFTIMQGQTSFSCLICRSVVSKRAHRNTDVKMHFIAKHFVETNALLKLMTWAATLFFVEEEKESTSRRYCYYYYYWYFYVIIIIIGATASLGVRI